MNSNANKTPFYLVWRENGGVPTRMHPSAAEAKNEAIRLARKHPGNTFYVLASTHAMVKHDVEVTNFVRKDDERIWC